jgi:acyl dehydratase
MRFRELHTGRVLELGAHLVTESEIVEFARRYDPQPFHVDRETAARSRWGGLIASGFQTCSLAMRMVAETILNGSESMGSPGLEYLKWPNPVRPGDRLAMRVEVLESSVSKSGRVGVVRWRWLMRSQSDEPVLVLVATSLFCLEADRREAAS